MIHEAAAKICETIMTANLSGTRSGSHVLQSAEQRERDQLV